MTLTTARIPEEQGQSRRVRPEDQPQVEQRTGRGHAGQHPNQPPEGSAVAVGRRGPVDDQEGEDRQQADGDERDNDVDHHQWTGSDRMEGGEGLRTGLPSPEGVWPARSPWSAGVAELFLSWHPQAADLVLQRLQEGEQDHRGQPGDGHGHPSASLADRSARPLRHLLSPGPALAHAASRLPSQPPGTSQARPTPSRSEGRTAFPKGMDGTLPTRENGPPESRLVGVAASSTGGEREADSVNCPGRGGSPGTALHRGGGSARRQVRRWRPTRVPRRSTETPGSVRRCCPPPARSA